MKLTLTAGRRPGDARLLLDGVDVSEWTTTVTVRVGVNNRTSAEITLAPDHIEIDADALAIIERAQSEVDEDLGGDH